MSFIDETASSSARAELQFRRQIAGHPVDLFALSEAAGAGRSEGSGLPRCSTCWREAIAIGVAPEWKVVLQADGIGTDCFADA
jgi:hypothetical protein